MKDVGSFIYNENKEIILISYADNLITKKRKLNLYYQNNLYI